MNKTLSVIIILGAIIIVIFYFIFRMKPPIPSRDEVWIPKNIVLLDSARSDNSRNAYLFCYNTGALGYSIKMVAVGNSVKEISHRNALVESDYISDIKWFDSHTLCVKILKNEYEMMNPMENVKIVIDSTVTPFE